MAKKEDKVTSRVLRQQFNSGYITVSDGSISAGSFPGYIVDDSVAAVRVHALNQYFDLEGYSLDDLTTFIQTGLFQRIGNNNLASMQADVFIQEYLILHTVPLSYADDFNFTPVVDTLPGSLTSTTSLQEIVNGWAGTYSQDEGAGFGRLTDATTWGVGDSTAADKLYYSRLFVFPKVKAGGGNATYGFNFSEVAVVVPIIVAKEPDLEYIMRLARSTQQMY